MRFWQLLALSAMITTSAIASVTSYFNQNQSKSYIDPYRNFTRKGDNLEAVILAQIYSAKKTIFVAVQEIRLPLVAQALIQKKNEGVDVRVVIEHDYNFDITAQRAEGESTNEHDATRLRDLRAFIDLNKNGKFEKSELETRDAIYMLKNAGVAIMDDTFDTSQGSGLMHHKFMVVDGKSTIVSTANFTMSCVHGDFLAPDTRGNANSLVLVQSVEFAKIFTEEFSQLWGNGKRGNYGHNKTYRGPQTVSVRGIKLTVQFSPTSRRYHWEESVNGLIASEIEKAQKSVKAALFVFSDQKISNAMEKRHNAGVQVGVMIERNFAYRDYSEMLDMLGLQMRNARCAYQPDNNPWKNPASEVGVPKLTQGDSLHHKFGVIDNQVVVMGSQNWSDSANYTNDETLIVVEGKGIAEQYAQEYERLKRTATMGAPAHILTQINRLEKDCNDKGVY